MSDTKYQEGIIKFSNGESVGFLCKPLSSQFTEDQMKELTVSDIQFFPEKDFKEEIKNKVLKQQLEDLPENDPEPEKPKDGYNESEINDGIGWDEAY